MSRHKFFKHILARAVLSRLCLFGFRIKSQPVKQYFSNFGGRTYVEFLSGQFIYIFLKRLYAHIHVFLGFFQGCCVYAYAREFHFSEYADERNLYFVQ